MADYTQSTFFTPKDTAPSGDSSKLIKGSELDGEFGAIETAIATKYDSADLASQAEAETGTDNTKLMTPLRVSQHADADASLIPQSRLVSTSTGVSGGGDLTADRTLILDTSHVRNVDHSAVSITAGDALAGGGTIDGSITLDFDMSSLSEAVAGAALDMFLVYDDSAAAYKKIDWDTLEATFKAYDANVYYGSNAAANDIATGADTPVTWTVPDDGGNPTRINIPSGISQIAISGSVFWAGAAGASRNIFISKNGTQLTTAPHIQWYNAGTNDMTVPFPRMIIAGLTGGTDYIEVEVHQNSGGALRCADANEYTTFTVEYID